MGLVGVLLYVTLPSQKRASILLQCKKKLNINPKTGLIDCAWIIILCFPVLFVILVLLPDYSISVTQILSIIFGLFCIYSFCLIWRN